MNFLFLLIAGPKHGTNPISAEVEEACSCVFGLHCVYEAGFLNITIEGDNLSLIRKLQSKSCHDSSLGLFVRSIHTFVQQFDFFSWSSIKREGNRIAHDLAHSQPMYLEGKL